MTEKKSKNSGYRRPRIGELKKKIKDLTDDNERMSKQIGKVDDSKARIEQSLTEAQNECHRLHDENTKLIAKLTEKESIIHQQAERIRELERELDIEKATLNHRQQEIDALYGRNWWQRLFNIDTDL